MAKFARTRTEPRSPVTATAADASTFAGGTAFSRDSKGELFLLAVANMVGQDTFYEAGDDRDQRFRDLIHTVTRQDPDWVARFVPYLRGEMNLRSAAIVLAAESALARKAGTDREPVIPIRKMVSDSMLRADEPAEFIAYWKMRTGSVVLPGGVQRGIADAAARLYTERAALKYDGIAGQLRMADVIALAKPHPKGRWQADVFDYLADRRWKRRTVRVTDRVPVLTAYREAMAVPEKERRAWFLADPARLGMAGMTWEQLSSLGPMDARAWSAIIPHMPLMALVKNLRNFDEAGVSDETAQQVCARLADPEQVRSSRQLPFRFWAAYKHTASLRWGHALEKALNAVLSNVPALPGRTLILVDRSPSMFPGFGFSTPNTSDITLAEQAAVFGAALATRAAAATLVEFGGTSRRLDVPPAGSVLRLIEAFGQSDGTDIPSAVRAHFAGHDRIVIVTDEQTRQGWLPSNMGRYGGMPETEIDALVPTHVPVYMWNMAGYRPGATPSGGSNRHAFGGLSDDAFRMILLLESGRDTRWPWEH